MKRALVTGGSGFLGSLLVRRLLADGWSTVNIDLQPDEHSHPRLESVQGDIRDQELLRRLHARHGFGVVFHCAAILAHGRTDERFLWTSNVDGTRNVAECAVEFGVRKVIYTSSNCLWGEGMGRPVREDDPPNPVELYGRSKWEGERILREHQSRLQSVTIRCPTILDAGRLGLLTILFEFIAEGRRVWVVGGGRNRYQFIYAPDLIEAMIRAVDYDQSNTFGIGSDDVKPLREVYQYVIDRAATGAHVASLPKAPTIALMRLAHRLRLSPLGPYHYKMIAEDFAFDTTRIKHQLGWRPSVTNEEMLWLAYEYYRENREQIERRAHASAHRRPARMGVIRLLKWLS